MYFNSSGIFRGGRSVFIIIENVLRIISSVNFFFKKILKSIPHFGTLYCGSSSGE